MHDNASTFLLFVYGTLKRGGCRHGPLAAQRFCGEARTAAQYALYDLGDYPGLVSDEQGGQAVEGELYEVSESLVPWLDAVEGAPTWFKRDPVVLQGAPALAWAYFYQGEQHDRPRVASGRWEHER
jgi:gamma-glutamylcyclotransferase (GGCT)/AIG2-like uncharacterized protein YtfP